MGGPRGTAFDQAQYDAIYPDGVERHYWNRSRYAAIVSLLRRSGSSGPILDVGCGKGLVVAALHGQGFEVRGVELADVPALPAVAQLVRCGTDALDLPEVERGQVSTILLLDVIEHLEDPGQFLARLRDGFPALRTVVVTVPARQELFSDFDVFNGHFRRYHPALLRQHLSLLQGRVIHLSYLFHALYPAALLLARHGRSRSFHAPAPGPANWLHAALGRLFLLEWRCLPRAWRGTSLLAAVRLERP
jgi:SAM-dependent methyltransferase